MLGKFEVGKVETEKNEVGNLESKLEKPTEVENVFWNWKKLIKVEKDPLKLER